MPDKKQSIIKTKTNMLLEKSIKNLRENLDELSMDNFIGKTIGTPQLSGTSYIGLLLFLNKYNLKDKVNIEKIGYTQISTLLSDKVAGAVCFYNNEPIQMRLMKVDTIQWDVKDFSDIIGASFISSKRIIKNKND